MKSHKELKLRQRSERDTYPDSMGMRVHRALSWLDRAERCEDDDGKIIFLWVAFNAAYANDVAEEYRESERTMFQNFLCALQDNDTKGLLSSVVWTQFTGPIRVLLQNQYIFQPFWDSLNGKESGKDWQQRFADANSFVSRALSRQETAEVLTVVMQRIYTLRNQLVHGGATWDSNVNRDQIRDCKHILEEVVPAILEIMMDNPRSFIGSHHYPVVD
ncbi:HEPN domain-containing protein [Paraferrimonas sedimenticola]|uniref:Apea-like HEPN domain-containing protein n=1 Tax=Paraferrimonas sedimenticola TaxID=375674 RepID=A0AA37RX34_9GAMM|nr:HEPN domain-containing protein [Paraferrimonas sedimenticola]GLP96996.1 hypothetical protein GCM10007895_23020 [Paraferrimonas sedimenticola]